MQIGAVARGTGVRYVEGGAKTLGLGAVSIIGLQFAVVAQICKKRM